jgi:A/G-specific adenine glycosylase
VLGRAILGRIASEREAIELDGRLGSRREPARWHHALMDIGATICLARRPRCDACPLRSICAYTGADDVVRRRQSPFATSDRRVRGAILRALRDRSHGVTMRMLRRLVIDTRVPRLVRVLAAEGLVEVSERGVRLPAR